MNSVYKSISKSIYPSVHHPLRVPAALLGGAAAPFSPEDIAGLRSWTLDGSPFYTDAIDGKYYLKDKSTTNTHLPRQGRCYQFDGSNDYLVLNNNVNTVWGGGSFTFSASVMVNSLAVIRGVVSVNNSASVLLWIATNGAIQFGSGAGFNNSAVSTISTSTWTHLTFVHDTSLSGLSRWIMYKNGVVVGVSSTAGSYAAPVNGTSGASLVGIRNTSLTSPMNGLMRDVRVYNVAKSAGEALAIYNQSATGNGTIDSTGLVLCHPCNEESGTTSYDISSNANHGTLTNITESTFHYADSGVLTNPNNADGYRLSSGDYIPKRIGSTVAADGNALTVTGRSAYHARMDVPCVTNNTGTIYIAAPHLVGTETVVSYSGTTTTPTVSSGRIDWDTGTNLSDITLSDGTRYVLQEGPGSSNTNRTVYNVDGSTNHATITNGTVVTFWSTRLTGEVKDWCTLYGGRIGAGGEFVPGRVSGSLCADGNAKTLVAGKFGNPFSRINHNPSSAAEFNGRSIPTVSEVTDDINAVVTPAESAFRRTAADGDDRFLIYDNTLSGADLTNVEGYVV